MKKALFLLLVTSLFILSACQGGNECETMAAGQIPSVVTLKKSGEEGSFWKHMENFKWMDGTAVENTADIYYRPGSEKGENVNYFYADDADPFGRKMLKYTKQSLSDEGIILGDNSFEISFVLKPLPETRKDETESVVGSSVIINSTQDFEVVEVRFNSCKWYN